MIADAMLATLYTVEQNRAYLVYQQTNAVIDNAIHEKAKSIAYITEKEDE